MAAIYKPKTQDQIYTAMKNFLVAKSSSLNNFNDGSRLNTILESISQESAENQNDFYQALLKAIPISIYMGFNFNKNPGTKSSGKMTFRRATSAPQTYSIPIGTQILLNGIKYQTTVEGEITSGNTSSGEIVSQCEVVGASYDIPINSIDTLIGQGSFINQPNGIESCKNETAFTNGTDEESDSDRIQRFRTFINSLARSTNSGIFFALLSVDGIKSASVVEYDPSDGWIKIYADDGTGNLSAEKKAEIEKIIAGDKDDYTNFPGYKACGIHFTVTAPTIVQIDITGVIYVPTTSELSDAEFITMATTETQKYTNALKTGQDWIKSEVITAVQNMHVDIYDFKASLPADNVTISAGQLAKTNIITYTVVRVTGT